MSERDVTDLPDLALETMGGAVLLANDEFFAEKENLLKADAPIWKEGVYTDRGKWMDGWETRRRREAGYDWCVVRLGLPGVIRGIVVDTAFFRGNFPESCSIEACEIDINLDERALASAAWTSIVPKSKLQGDSRNLFEISVGQRFTHVRLNIFPDGGVARLRVHGDVVPDWRRLRRHGGVIDLAALENGAKVTSCSDMFFGSRHNLVRPGRAVNMSDGWETKRRRGPGHDWAIVKLGAPGMIDRIEIDTTHFKGNAPGRVTLEAAYAPKVDAPEAGEWRPVLASPTQPHTVHHYETELRRVGVVSHVRLAVYPDGGISRLRVFGAPDVGVEPGLVRLNTLETQAAAAALLTCCGSRRWVAQMNTARPFEDVSAMLRIGERIWWQLDESDWLEAFDAHPKIGAKGGSKWSAQEQAGTTAADERILDEMAAANQAYLDEFGFIYIVCATGKSAESMLAQLHERLASSRERELRTAAEEQAMITRLRLQKWVKEQA